MNTSTETAIKTSWLDRPVIPSFPKIKLEHLLVTLIILLTIISRFYNVGARVMSHDEVNHVVPSYDLYIGKGYSHDPVTHGPMQFHLLAASYFLFGDNDVSSRIPSALFSIATVAFVLFAWKRYLGRTGALLSGFFFMISPYMLFYGRYTRNEAFVGLFGVILLYAVLHYLEKGKHSTLYLYTAVLSLYFCTKETSFIFTAEMLIFLAFVFLKDITQKEWKRPGSRDLFILLVMIALLFVGVALGAGVIDSKTAAEATAVVDGAVAPAAAPSVTHIIMLVAVGLAGLGIVAALVLLLIDLGWSNIRDLRSFDLLLLTLTLVMPQLIAFPISLLGWNPLDYSQTGLIRTSIVLAVVVVLAVAIGLVWKPMLWLKNAAIFYSIFTILYTTVFTNGQGFFTGMVGSLGYWLSQQSVNRGTQPWYYYAFIQIPMYEYLAAFGTLTALVVGIWHNLLSSVPGIAPADQIKKAPAAIEPEPAAELPARGRKKAETAVVIEEQPTPEAAPQRLPVVTLLVYWSIMSLIAFSVAGEKMPWLTVHITLPMLLASGFGIGFLVDTLKVKWDVKSIVTLLLFPVFLISFAKTIGMLAGAEKPFAGTELVNLQATSTFLFSLIAAGLSGWGIVKLLKGWKFGSIFKTLLLAFFAISAVLTARSAFQSSYINYDTGKEFLVYAHSARGPKDVLEQVEDISLRTTGGKDIKVAYIGDALYPYWWYFRDYPNKTWIKDKLNHDLTQYTVVISDDVEIAKARAILDNDYYEFKYKRLVWPMQDYMNQTFKSIRQLLKDPQMAQALFDIWLNKDYTLYAQIRGISTLTVENWEPSGNIYLFIKKDVVASIWTYGTVPTAAAVETDPYAANMLELVPDQYFGTAGTGDGQFTNPHGIAVAPNGDIYVADARNHRIQRFSVDGQFKQTWGSYGSVDNNTAPGGTFNEPWGIAVGPDGSVYVTDTWNYRIQKFTADGGFVTMWGTSGAGDATNTFWGPRGITVDQQGRVFVTDTGNNRVVIFDANGGYLAQFGTNGLNPGEFDEPVGLAVDQSNNVYVVDTWNKRIQVFQPVSNDLDYQYLREWSVSGWEGQSINNKPFIALDAAGNVYVTDPDGYRVLEFTSQGEFIRGWGDYSSGIDGFGQPIGIAVDAQGRVLVSDSENNYILRFVLPTETAVEEAGQPQGLPEGLPELPVSSTVLTYNLTNGLVEDPFQQAVYRLDVDGSQWIPVVPQGIADLLPADATPVKNEVGEWMLLQSDGTMAFKWDPNVLLWISTSEAVPSAT